MILQVLVAVTIFCAGQVMVVPWIMIDPWITSVLIAG
jgi:hypothetical protein